MSNYYITLTQAILGCKIDVHTIDGPTILTLAPGVEPDQQLLLKGLGLKVLGSD